MRRGRLEIATIGFNPNLQLVGSDPNGSPYDLGLFVGANASADTPTERQLIMLCQKQFNAGQRGRLVGFRQYLTMGVNIPVTAPGGAAFYPLERPIETPTWKFIDGNVLWGIRRVPPSPHWKPNLLNADGFAFEWSETPAQLFESVAGGVVTPPYGGLFPGNVLVPELGRFFDLRCRRWSQPVELDIPFEGPCNIAFFASIQQTNPATRTPAPPIGDSPPIPVSQQINGNIALPGNSANEHWYVVTTSGGVGTVGELYFDNGSGAGNVTIIPATIGATIIPSTNFTGGSITLNAGQEYVWNGSAWIADASTAEPGQFTTTSGALPEDAFLQNYPGSTYFRIAGALIFEMEEQAPTGAPKTYRRPGDADRITRDTTEVGDNTMRRSAEDTSEYKAAKAAQPVKRPQSPPHVTQSLGELPKDVVEKSTGIIARISRAWRDTRSPGGPGPGYASTHKAPTLSEGLGQVPRQAITDSERAIDRIARLWRSGKIGGGR